MIITTAGQDLFCRECYTASVHRAAAGLPENAQVLLHRKAREYLASRGEPSPAMLGYEAGHAGHPARTRPWPAEQGNGKTRQESRT